MRRGIRRRPTMFGELLQTLALIISGVLLSTGLMGASAFVAARTGIELSAAADIDVRQMGRSGAIAFTPMGVAFFGVAAGSLALTAVPLVVSGAFVANRVRSRKAETDRFF